MQNALYFNISTAKVIFLFEIKKILVSLSPNCKIMKRFKIFFIVLCSVLTAKAQSIVFNNQVPKHEVRAVWLTTIGGIDWPHSYAQSSYSAEKQKKELTDILDRLQQAKNQYRTDTDPRERYHDLSVGIRTLGWMSVRISGQKSGL